MSDYFWTKEGIAFVTRRWAEGASAGIIARELGLTRNAVIGRVHRSNLPKRPTNSQSRAQRRPKDLVARRPARMTKIRKPPRTLYAAPYIPVDPIRFLDRRLTQCAFIPGDPRMGTRAPEIMCCGAKTVPGSSWCQLHFRLVYLPAEKREQKVRDGSSARFIWESAA